MNWRARLEIIQIAFRPVSEMCRHTDAKGVKLGIVETSVTATLEFLRFVFVEIFAGQRTELQALRKQSDDHNVTLLAIAGVLTSHTQYLQNIVSEGEKIMAFAQDVQTLISEIGTETDNIAARLDALTLELQNDPTPEQEAAILSQLGQVSGRLRVLGADPNNPIPPV